MSTRAIGRRHLHGCVFERRRETVGADDHQRTNGDDRRAADWGSGWRDWHVASDWPVWPAASGAFECQPRPVSETPYGFTHGSEPSGAGTYRAPRAVRSGERAAVLVSQSVGARHFNRPEGVGSDSDRRCDEPTASGYARFGDLCGKRLLLHTVRGCVGAGRRGERLWRSHERRVRVAPNDDVA